MYSVVIGSLNETELRLLVYLLFAFLVQLLSYYQSTYNDHQTIAITTYSEPLRYRNLIKSISPSLTTSTTYNNT